MEAGRRQAGGRQEAGRRQAGRRQEAGSPHPKAEASVEASVLLTARTVLSTEANTARWSESSTCSHSHACTPCQPCQPCQP